jgi:ribose transport system substrate-binding protein
MIRYASLSLAIPLLLGACGEKSAPPPAAAPAKATVRHIGLVMKTLTNPFFVEMEKGARRAEAELGITLDVKTAAQETSIDQQIQLVEDMIAAHEDAIVISPGDSQTLVPVLKKAADAGIKIVNIDNRLDALALQRAGMKSVPFISVDNEKAAYEAARLLCNVSEPTEAAILEGIRSADNAQQRAHGARRAFEENKQIKIVASESANWKIDEAFDVTKRIFADHPKVKLLFAANDMMALGAIRYLGEAGRSDVRVASYDALTEAIDAVKADKMVVTVDQQAAEQGHLGVVLAMKLIKGEQVPDLTLVDTKLVTKANAH